MTWWTVGTAVVGSVVGGAIAASGARSAADTQAAAATHAADISKQEFDIMTAQQQPFMQSGYGAQGQLNYLMGIGPNPSAVTSPYMQPQAGGGNTWTGQLGGPSASGPGARLQLGPGGADSSNQYGATRNTRFPTGIVGQVTGQNFGMGGGTNTGFGMGVPTGPNAGAIPTASGSPAGGYGSLVKPFSIEDFRNLSPAYKFQLQQGQQGVLNGDASNAGALSGAAQKDLMGYNQSMADTAFNTAFNQYQTQQGNIYSRLAGIATLGQNAAANTGAQGANLAGQVAQSVTNAGSAAAAGQVGAANAWSGAVGNASMLPWLMKGGGGNGYVAPSPENGLVAPSAPNIGGLFGNG